MSNLDLVDITPAPQQQSSYIKVIGVGGAGTNAVNHMFNKGIKDVDFIVCNTDKQSLDASPVATKIQLGDQGLGVGNDPAKGQAAAVSCADKIKAVLSNNTNMLFIAAGMGGGTGTGASPEIAKIAKEIELEGGNDEILVVAVVTIPFSWEGRKRREQAKTGIDNLKKVVDAIITINTDRLKGKGNMLLSNAFAMADDVLLTAAKGISEIMTANAYVHVDFRDVQSVMQHSGVALMGRGIGEGEDRAYNAIVNATTSELLNNNDLKDTKNMLLYISYSSKEEFQIKMDELQTIMNYVEELTNQDVDKIWGYGYDDSLEDKIAITIVATGFEDKEIYHEEMRSTSIKNDLTAKSKPSVIFLDPKAEEKKVDTAETNKVEPSITATESAPTNKPEVRPTPIDKSLEITIKEAPEKTSVGVMDPQPEQTTRIRLGDPLPSTQTQNTVHQQERTIESKEDILKQFAKTDTEIELNVTTKQEETIGTERNIMNSLFAESENKEMDDIFRRENIAVNRPSLKDTITKDTFVSEEKLSFDTPASPMDAMSKTPEMRENRVKRIRELLKTGHVDFVESLRPTVDDIDEKLSEVENPQTKMGVSKDGTITMVENPVIGSGVD